MKFATNLYGIIQLTLGVSLHYLGKFKIQISFRLSTVPVSGNILNSLLTQSFVQRFSENFVCQPLCCVPLQIQTFFIKISSSSRNAMLIVDKHYSDVCCSEFSVPQIDRKSK